MPDARLLKIANQIFAPPFKRLGWVIWGYIVFCILINPSSQIIHGNLPHSEDYAYLVQAIDWLHGQALSDGLQHRIDPSPLDALPLSRFLTITYGILISALTPLLNEVNSATLVAAIFPLLCLGLFLATLKWAAKPFMNSSWTGVTAYVSLFALPLLPQFAPGTVTEFGLECVIVAAALGCAGRMITYPSLVRWPLIAAAVLTLAQLLGGQALLPVFAFTVWLGVWTVATGGQCARTSCLFALGLFSLGSMLFIITNPLDLGPRINIWDHFKIYAFLSSALFACFVSFILASQITHRVLRFVVAGFLGGIICLSYNFFFPVLAKALYQVITLHTDTSALLALKQIPLPEIPKTFSQEVSFYLWSSLAFAASLFHIFRSDERSRRWHWAGTALLIAFFGILAACFQPGLIIFVETVSILPLSAFFQTAWQKLPERFAGKALKFARAGLVIVIGPLFTVILTALVYERPLLTGVILFPNQFITYPCDMHTLTIALDLPNGYGDKPLHILNPEQLGQELLFRTPHSVSAPSYETTDDRQSNSGRFFSTHSEEEAAEIARTSHADLVVVCDDPSAPNSVLMPPQITYPKSAQESQDFKKDTEHSFVQELIGSKNPPPLWLRRVNFPFLQNMMAWKVLLPKKAQENPESLK